MARPNRTQLDVISAMSTVAHAAHTDLLLVSWTGDKRRWLCMTHAEQVAYAMRNARKKGAPLKLEPLNDIDQIIARSDIEDYARTGKWKFFTHKPTSDVNWRNCPHCRRHGRSAP
jgi:GTP-dependent phosphoenolpyruvate carboxykinase